MSARERHSLLSRLLLRTGVVVAALLFASGMVSYIVALHYSDEVHDRWLDDSARTLATQIRYVAQQPALDLPEVALEMFVWDEQDEIYFEVTARNNRRVAGNAHFTDLPPLTADEGRRFVDTNLNGKPLRAVMVAVKSPVRDEVISVVVAETLNKRAKLAREILFASVPVQLILIIVGGIALWWGLRGGLRVVDTIASAIRARDPSDSHSVAFPEAAPSEIEPLITALNDLIARVDKARQAQQRFVANAAHQLRTPIATLQVQAERAMLEEDPEQRARALAHLNGTVRRVGHLLHQILTLARLEPEALGRATLAQCDLNAIARDAIERHLDMALAREIDIGLSAPDRPVEVSADRTLVAEMLANLIDNAIQYGHAGGHITLGVTDMPPCLYVEDDGPGIPADERELVWDRFYRVRGTGGIGCGLGLAIVREIADLHAATVDIGSAVDGVGTRVSIRFSGARRDRADAVRTDGAHSPARRAATSGHLLAAVREQ